ncbi:hypothetical protein K439DRAFT_1186423 [Ramaria rubella]|nr:hypothetical protein K439DRAFT_1186423 [Ramaria rubella]
MELPAQTAASCLLTMLLLLPNSRSLAATSNSSHQRSPAAEASMHTVALQLAEGGNCSKINPRSLSSSALGRACGALRMALRFGIHPLYLHRDLAVTKQKARGTASPSPTSHSAAVPNQSLAHATRVRIGLARRLLVCPPNQTS